jgi:hypothetical protein
LFCIRLSPGAAIHERDVVAVGMTLQGSGDLTDARWANDFLAQNFERLISFCAGISCDISQSLNRGLPDRRRFRRRSRASKTQMNRPGQRWHVVCITLFAT